MYPEVTCAGITCKRQQNSVLLGSSSTGIQNCKKATKQRTQLKGMAKYNSFGKRFSNLNPVKLLSLFFDVLIHFSITVDNSNACMLGLPFSSSGLAWVSSPFAVVLTFALVFVILAIILLVIKYWSLRKCEDSLSCGEMTYDFLSLFMGVFYLIGDNLSDDVCRQWYSCTQFSITSTTCRIKDNRECNPTTCRKSTEYGCKAEGCRSAAIALLGLSTVINLFLIFLENVSFSKRALPAIGIAHNSWMSTFNLLTYAILFDQTLSGLHGSLFSLTSERQVKCDNSVHGAGGSIHGIAVVIWFAMFGCLCYKDFPEKPYARGKQKDCCTEYCCGGIMYVLFHFLVWAFFFFYINADTPWPWDCYEGEDSRRLTLIIRLSFFAVSLLLIIIFLFLYAIIVFIPTIHEQCCGNKALDHSEVLQVLRNLPTSDERFRLASEEDSSLHISYKFDEGIMTASYTVSITNDHEWTSTYQKFWTKFRNFISSRCGCRDTNEEEPHSGDNTTEPHSGDNTTEPHSGDNTTEPHSGDNTTEPHSGDNTTEPHSSDNTTEPHSGDNTTEPHSSDNTTEPHSSDNTTEPHSSDNTTEPHSSDNTTEPHSGDNTTEPHSGDNTTEPHSSDNTTEPHSSDNTTEPHSSDNTTEPHSSDNTTEPHSSDNTTEPHSGDNTFRINGQKVCVVKGAFCNDSQSENTLNDVYRLYTGVNTTPGDDSVVFLPNCSISKENDGYVATADSSKYTVLQQEVRSVPTQESTSQHGENSGAQSQPDNISTLQPSEDAQDRPDSPPPGTDLIPQPVTDLIPQPVTDLIPQPVTDLIPQPVTDLITPPVTDLIPQPVTDLIPQPVTDPITPPVTDLIPQPVTDLITPPVTDLIPPPGTCRHNSPTRPISSTNGSLRLHTNSNSPHDIERNLEDHTICTNNSSKSSQSCGPQTTPDSTPQVNTVGSEQSPPTSPFIMQVDDIPQGIVLLYPNGLVFRLRRDPSSSKFHTHVCINFINGHKHSSIINFACYKVTIMGNVLFASSREQLSELKTCVISS